MRVSISKIAREMGFSARLLNRDFEDLVICYLCKEVLEDVIALACCSNHCCRKCFDNRKRAGDRCVEECGAQIENLIEDRPKKQELCEVGDFQCTRCFFKPLRYDQLVGHMRNECARRDVHCRYCDRTHAADYVESCINNPDAAAIKKQTAKLEREVQLYKDQMEDAQKTANEANMRIEAVRQREDILQTRLNQQTLKLRREEAISKMFIFRKSVTEFIQKKIN